MRARLLSRLMPTAFLALVACPINTAFALNPAQKLPEYKHVAWRIGDSGLTGTPVSIAQSGDGYIWVGTTAGLLQFDGVRFSVWKKGVEKSALIRRLFRASDGSLWFNGTSEIERLRDRTIETYGSSERSILVNYITEDDKGVLWYLRSDARLPPPSTQICSLMLGSRAHCEPLPGTKGTSYYSVCACGNALWIGSDTGLVRLRDGNAQVYPIAGLESYTNNGNVSSLEPDGQGGMFVGIERAGTKLGLERLSGENLAPVRVGTFDGSQLAVASLHRDRYGALWVGTVSDGLYRIYGDRVEHFGTLQGLSSPLVQQIVEDYEGSIWVVTSRGVDQFSELAIVTLSNDEDFHSNEVDGVRVMPDGTLWVSGGSTLLTLSPGAHKFMSAATLPVNAVVTSVLEDHTGIMWVGVNDTLNKLQDGKFVAVKQSSGQPLGMIISIAEDRAFNLWAIAAGPPRQIVKINPTTLEAALAPNFPPASRLLADPEGGIYIAALTGDVIHVDVSGTRVVYPHPPGKSSRIWELALSPDGSVLASTDLGLFVMRDGVLRVMDDRNGLPCDAIYDAIFDSEQNLWLYSQCGLARVLRGDLANWRQNPSAVLPTLVLDAEDGAAPFRGPFGGAARTPDGVLWFATIGSLQKFDPNSPRRAAAAPPVHIERLTADGESFSIYGSARLPALTRDIQIDFSGLSFIAPDKVRFRYRLEGFDRDWKEVAGRRQAFYTALPPATYRFRVLAGSAGVWNSTGAAVEFALLPAFYQTLWFKGLCSSVVLALLWLTFHIRIKQVAAEVRLRQSVQHTERERIARQLHDTFLQSVQGLVLRLASAVKKVPLELPIRAVFDDILTQSDEVIDQARDSIQELRDREKRSLSLPQEISAIGQRIADDTSIRVTVLPRGEPYELTPEAYENLHLIAQEAMLNAKRHAQASVIEVEIDYLEDEFRLSVRDDGKGIDEEILKLGREGHWGLLGMRERAQAIHGKLRIMSRSGIGTDLEVTVPRGAAAAANAQTRRPKGWCRRNSLLVRGASSGKRPLKRKKPSE
jgi:signal transduction histidine kinase/ligand-binding sensor domain-containing protein